MQPYCGNTIKPLAFDHVNDFMQTSIETSSFSTFFKNFAKVVEDDIFSLIRALGGFPNDDGMR